MRLLCEVCADKVKACEERATPLVIASYSGRLEIVRLLCAGEDKYKPCDKGAIPFFIASHNGHLWALAGLTADTLSAAGFVANVDDKPFEAEVQKRTWDE